MAYYLKITMESGNGNDVYQTTEFTQNYSEHEQQILEMQSLFPDVAALIGGKMVENGTAGIERMKKKGG